MQGERKCDRDPTSSGLEAEGGRATEREEDQRESGVMEEWKRQGKPGATKAVSSQHLTNGLPGERRLDTEG